MGKKGNNAGNDLGDAFINLFRVFVIAVVVIYGLYAIVAALIPTVPLWIQVVFGGLLAAFVYSIRDQIMEHLKNIGKKPSNKRV